MRLGAMVPRMRKHLWMWILFACGNDKAVQDPDEDPACAEEVTPAARTEDEAWDLDRGFDSDRPVCAADDPECDFLDEPDAFEEEVELDDAIVPYGLSDPLTSTGKYRAWPNGRIPYKFARTNGVIQVNAATRTAL